MSWKAINFFQENQKSNVKVWVVASDYLIEGWSGKVRSGKVDAETMEPEHTLQDFWKTSDLGTHRPRMREEFSTTMQKTGQSIMEFCHELERLKNIGLAEVNANVIMQLQPPGDNANVYNRGQKSGLEQDLNAMYAYGSCREVEPAVEKVTVFATDFVREHFRDNVLTRWNQKPPRRKQRQQRKQLTHRQTWNLKKIRSIWTKT